MISVHSQKILRHTIDNLIDITSGWGGMTLALMLALEELLEMLGILVFVYALLSYIDIHVRDIQIHFPGNHRDLKHYL